MVTQNKTKRKESHKCPRIKSKEPFVEKGTRGNVHKARRTGGEKRKRSEPENTGSPESGAGKALASLNWGPKRTP